MKAYSSHNLRSVSSDIAAKYPDDRWCWGGVDMAVKQNDLDSFPPCVGGKVFYVFCYISMNSVLLLNTICIKCTMWRMWESGIWEKHKLKPGISHNEMVEMYCTNSFAISKCRPATLSNALTRCVCDNCHSPSLLLHSVIESTIFIMDSYLLVL